MDCLVSGKETVKKKNFDNFVTHSALSDGDRLCIPINELFLLVIPLYALCVLKIF